MKQYLRCSCRVYSNVLTTQPPSSIPHPSLWAVSCLVVDHPHGHSAFSLLWILSTSFTASPFSLRFISQPDPPPLKRRGDPSLGVLRLYQCATTSGMIVYQFIRRHYFQVFTLPRPPQSGNRKTSLWDHDGLADHIHGGMNFSPSGSSGHGATGLR